MNNLELINNEPMATSRDIAHKLNKEHRDVTRKIREVLTVREYTHREYNYGNNNKATELLLTKDSFILLVMNYEGYNDFKRAYIKQFNEMLEELNKPKEPPTQLQLAEQVVELLKERETNKSKVEFFDTVTQMDSWLTFKEVANILNIKELGRNNLTKRLRVLGYLTNFNKPYQRYINQKLFKVIETKKGNKVYTSTVTSQKGLDVLIRVLK